MREDGLVRRTIKQKAFGGALYVGDLKTSIESCVINSNYAASSGGGIHLAGGSASLSIQGNTVVDENMAGESGTAIYSESGGGIALRNTSSVNFVSGVAASGIMQECSTLEGMCTKPRTSRTSCGREMLPSRSGRKVSDA